MAKAKYANLITIIKSADGASWDIGDELLEVCGTPPGVGDRDGSHTALEEAAAAIKAADVEDYSVARLSQLRCLSYVFPKASRASGFSYAVHEEAGSPEVLNAIIHAAGKHVTKYEVRAFRKAIEEQQERERRTEPGYKKPPKKTKRSKLRAPTPQERKGLALIAQVLRWVQDIKESEETIVRITDEVEANLPRLVSEDINYLVEISLSLGKNAHKLADVARKLKANKRDHLISLEGGKSHG